MIDKLIEAMAVDSPKDAPSELLLWYDTLSCPKKPGELYSIEANVPLLR